MCLITITAKKGMQDGPVFCPYFPQRRYPVREIYGINTVPSVPVMGTNRRACMDGPRGFSHIVPCVPVDFSVLPTDRPWKCPS